MIYDGTDGSSANDFTGLGIDITNGGRDTAFVVRVESGWRFPDQIRLWVYSSRLERSSLFGSYSIVPSGGVGLHVFPLDRFTGRADLTDVGLLWLNLDGDMDEELCISYFGTVPEPGVSYLLVVGLVVVGGSVFLQKRVSRE
ncbi:MAG: hypothetical protein GY722_15210 [bacterium]|nr:hypothetical protein [bacterium]